MSQKLDIQINNILLPEAHHGANLRDKVDTASIESLLAKSLKENEIEVTEDTDNKLVIDIHRFYVRGGPGWLTCNIDIYLTARAEINGTKVSPKNFHRIKRVFFCSFSENDKRFNDEIQSLIQETFSHILTYVNNHLENSILTRKR